MIYCEQIIMYNEEKMTSLLQFLTSPLAHLQMTEVCLNDVLAQMPKQKKNKGRKLWMESHPYVSLVMDMTWVRSWGKCCAKKKEGSLINAFAACFPRLSLNFQVFWPQGYKTFFILNSAEHQIYAAHKC